MAPSNKRKLGTNKSQSKSKGKKDEEIASSDEDHYLPSPDDSFSADSAVEPRMTRLKKSKAGPSATVSPAPPAEPATTGKSTVAKSTNKAIAGPSKSGPSKSKSKDASGGNATRLQTFEWIAYAGRAFTASAATLVQMEIIKSQSKRAELNAARRADEARQVTLTLELKLKTQEAEARALLTEDERHQEYEKALQDMRNESDRVKSHLAAAEAKILTLRQELVDAERLLSQSKRDLALVEIQKTRTDLEAARK
ncbi:hypothetical protein FS749_009471 [Ceratobasidium sp. UAMH 11750]|nr:hypothetical protein FS749_009471 [Ceratobasidium sp. UAMH 11750]